MARSRTPIGNEDVDKYRCTRCGFPCDLKRDKINPGNGNVYTTVSSSQTSTPDDGTPAFGCPQCGRGDYTDSKFFR